MTNDRNYVFEQPDTSMGRKTRFLPIGVSYLSVRKKTMIKKITDLHYLFGGSIRRFAYLVLSFFITGLSLYSQSVVQRNYLSNALLKSGFEITAPVIEKWRADNKRIYVERFRSLPQPVKQSILNKADAVLDFDWPALPASSFLEFKITGNRTGYERKQLIRRDNLYLLVIGWLISQDKKYLEPIANGLWATMEESTWEIPAIVELQRIGKDLPDPSEEIVGLVNAETAVNIAMIRFLLADELDRFSPVINKRIDYELQKRIINPYLTRNDYWWMGFRGNSVNNWNAWINTNILHTALLAINNVDTLSLLMQKVFKSTDYFINQYPADGGCDEGPSYWNEAGGKLIRLLCLSRDVSGGKLTWAKEELLHNMGSYIHKMHIGGTWFVNFADAVPKSIPNPESVFKYGELFNDDTLRDFAAFLFHQSGNKLPLNTVVGFVQAVSVFNELNTLPQQAPLPGKVWLPDLQVAALRSEGGSKRGLFLAVQGGHNGESHNHNDVGNFILYQNGHPVIVDAGVGTYNAQTFSASRYELWNMQSQWHNCPTINGVMQQEGKEFRASGFSLQANAKNPLIKLDIADAYPHEAGVRKWERSFEMIAGKMILKETYQLEKRSGETSIHFLSACHPREEKGGVISFLDSAGQKIMVLKYDAAVMTPVINGKKLDDPKMIAGWGTSLYRISFALKNTSVRSSHRFEFVGIE